MEVIALVLFMLATVVLSGVLVRTLPLLRVLPAGAFDRVVGFLGVNASMDGFEGRRPR